jgi:predicted DNA-binding protein YlxM (UPF0122 family)
MRNNNKIVFSDVDVDSIVKYYCEEKLSCQEISYRFNCSENTINRLLKKRGLLREGRSDGKKIEFSDVEVDNIIKYYCDERLSCEEISSIFNCSRGTINSLLTKRGLLREGQKKIEFSDAEVDKIIKYYCEEQLSCQEISSMFNCTRKPINSLLKKRGLIRTGVNLKLNGGVCKEYRVNGIKCHGSFEKYYIEFLNNNGLECPKNAEPISTPYGIYYPDFSFPNSFNWD